MINQSGFKYILVYILFLVSPFINLQAIMGFRWDYDMREFTETAERLVSLMSIDEKVGQLSALSVKALQNTGGIESISHYKLGAIFIETDSLPFDAPDVQPTFENWRNLINKVKSAVVQINGKVIPLLIGINAIHGNQQVLGRPIFPHNIGLGATHDPILINEIGAWTAYQCKEVGFNWIFAPNVSFAKDYRWGGTYECFGSSPKLVGLLAESFVLGAQARSGKYITGVMTSPKYFLGDGNTYRGVDQGNVIINNPIELRSFYKETLLPFERTFYANSGTLLLSHNLINGIPISNNPSLLNNLLKRGKGVGINLDKPFKGVIVANFSDIEAIAKLKGISHKGALVESINAGVDLFLFNSETKDYYNVNKAFKEAIEEGLIPKERIDDAVIRVLRVKAAMGLLNSETPKMERPRSDPYELAIQAAEKSLVLLKNNNDMIPFEKESIKTIILLGDYGDDIGTQCGGSTITWQGETGNKWWLGDHEDLKATSLKDGLLAIYENQIDLQENPEIPENLNAETTLAIVTLAEPPYAEWMGDVANNNILYYEKHVNPNLPQEQKETLEINFSPEVSKKIDKLLAQEIPVITILFSGRPMLIEKPLNKSDAFIAAWLPGTGGGQALANSIFGNYRFGLTHRVNTLPVPWPKSMEQLGDKTLLQIQPLFKINYGYSTRE